MDKPKIMPISNPMFRDFLKRLTAPAAAPLDQIDARLALGALLVRVAKSDEHYDGAEAAKIDQLLSKRYGLNSTQADELRTQCEVLEFEAPDTIRFTRAIKQVINHEDRVSVIEDLWAVVLADGTRDADENTLMRLVANLLGVNDVESAKARHRMQADID